MRKAYDDSVRGDGARRVTGDPARQSCDSAGLLRQVTGPASTRCDARRSPAQSVESRGVALRGHYVMSEVPPVRDAKGCICGPCDASKFLTQEAERSRTGVHQCQKD